MNFLGYTLCTFQTRSETTGMTDGWCSDLVEMLSESEVYAESIIRRGGPYPMTRSTMYAPNDLSNARRKKSNNCRRRPMETIDLVGRGRRRRFQPMTKS